MVKIEGKQLINFKSVATRDEWFYSTNHLTGESMGYRFFNATERDVDMAVRAAVESFEKSRHKSGAEKAIFLDAIVDEIEKVSTQLIELAHLETALPKPRLENEKIRTINQIKLFAKLLREGSWVEAKIDTGNPNRAPLAKPDLRSMQVAIGPVAVFGASNFPLAFSVAGGDTISALAAGCPVVYKAHPAHPATSELVGKAIIAACRTTHMPKGLFALVQGDGPTVGMLLVKHPGIKAVGFTGSYRAGKAIFDAAAQRAEPIPVFAEMGSTNPVFVLPKAMKERGEEIAAGYAASVTVGVGQFCTNPGILIHTENESAKRFHDLLNMHFSKTKGGKMLSKSITNSYKSGISERKKIDGLQKMSEGLSEQGDVLQQPILFQTSTLVFYKNPQLEHELFGPSSTVVVASSKTDMLRFAESLSGHLTATVHGTDDELLANKPLLDILEQKVGRIVINGFPTGVEVSPAMVHGGPFPATTNASSTSVGTGAIYRFTRPVCYQDLPDALLPAELKTENPLGIWRWVDGDFKI